MRMPLAIGAAGLAREIEQRVRRTTHGRIRGLSVEEIQGRVEIRGQVSSHHTRQLALHAALEVLSGEECRSLITVG